MKNPFKQNITVVTAEINGEKWFKFNNDYERVKYFYGNLVTILLILVLVVIATVMFLKVFPYIDLLKTNPCQLCEDLGMICST